MTELEAKTALRQILELREKFQDQPVYGNTIYVANNERWQTSTAIFARAGETRFFNETISSAIRQ